MITDTTFFTNEPGYALLDRFIKTLKHVQKRKKALEQKLHKNPRQIKQILNSMAISQRRRLRSVWQRKNRKRKSIFTS